MDMNGASSRFEYDAQDFLFELAEFCGQDQTKFIALTEIFLRALTEQAQPGVCECKPQEALEALVVRLFRVGGDINVVSRERAQFEFLSRVGLIKEPSQKQELTAFISGILGQDGIDAPQASNIMGSKKRAKS